MEILNKIKSVKLCLMAHPDNEIDSEFADRISDLEEIENELSKDSWIKVESENDFPKEDLDCHFIFKRQETRYQSFGVYDLRLKSFWSGALKVSNVTHYQEIIKPNAPTI